MKKSIVIFGILFLLTGCQEQKVPSENSSSENLHGSKSSSVLSSESTETTEQEEREDLHIVYNEKDFQKGFQELLNFIEPEDYLLPAAFTKKPEENYFSGYAHQFGFGDYSLCIVETDYNIKEVTESFDLIADYEPWTRIEAFTYGTAESAESQVPHENAHEFWLKNPYEQLAMKFDLGYGVTGYMLAGTQEQTVSWNDGNWHIEFFSYNLENKEAAATMARQLVKQIQEISLPKDAGIGHYYTAYDAMTGEWSSNILWTVSERRYQINTRKKEMSAALEIASSMRKVPE